MKNIVMISIIVLVAAFAVRADYTYTYGQGTSFGGQLNLNGTKSILVNGGGGGILGLTDYSSGRIESTSRTSDYPGFGIGVIGVGGEASLVVTGGEINAIEMSYLSHVTLSGGSINMLHARLVPPIPAVPEDKYIQFICKSYSYATGTKRLTGIWGDDNPFNIYLTDTSPWPNHFTFDSINFTIVPEPMTLALLALGSLAVRRYTFS